MDYRNECLDFYHDHTYRECHSSVCSLANFAFVLRAMGPLSLISIFCYSNFLGAFSDRFARAQSGLVWLCGPSFFQVGAYGFSERAHQYS